MRSSIACLLLQAACVLAVTPSKVSVYVKDQAITRVVHNTLEQGASAVGQFEDALTTKGWGILDVKGSTVTTDADLAFAAGAVEGLLSYNRISDHYQNMYKSHFASLSAAEVQEVKSWLEKQYNWTKKEAEAKKGSSGVWEQVGNVMSQFDGLVAGYNMAVNGTSYPALTQFDFLVLNGDGDLFQIVPAVLKHKRPDFDKMSNDEADNYLARAGKCSSIIKVTGNFSDLFMGHSSWYTYAATNRVFKHYNLGYTSSNVAAKKVSFSSYPGYLESLDDFYMMSSGLGMVQTSISFSNKDLYDLITPESLLAWQRVRAASVVAKTGEEWHQAVSTSHSGTYCNQYMIVDYNKFTPGKPLVAGTLYVIEEIPGQIPGGDMTEILSYGYWPSYNVPYFPNIYATSGMQALALRGVPSADYQTAPRALIFRRDADTVVDLDSYKAILRYNEYKSDPYAEGKPCNAVCCRGDLEGGSAFGCYDTKVTHQGLFQEMTAHAVNGPTRGGKNNLPAFSWSQFPDEKPVGLPETYDFDFIVTKPSL
eukprot:TRINITY_DN526_c0_g1_i3.p2 TRINITY_DN526_c0_g1~~TRINITY_DN526_c0_g1_i3.p2  ORF type:complete len:536 (+),score=260.16 TRINITY_DN526_c0_g1_i3:43-1650(+)